MIKKLILSCLLLSCIYAQTAVAPSAGDGSISNPYQIATLENLYWISADSLNWDKHYIQIADIDAAETENWFSGSGWLPIGTPENKFSASYQGNGYSISNLHINRKTSDFNGLFGYILHAKISSLGLNNIDYCGKNFTGGLIGKSDSSIVKNCFTTGLIFIDGEYDYTGGLIGDCRNTTVSTSYAQTDIECGTYYEYGENVVYRAEYIGGLIGYCKNSSSVFNCYATGDVGDESHHTVGTTQRGSNYVGGLIGYQYYYSPVEYCYSTGSVQGTGVASRNGGLIGEGRGYSRVKYCFWDTVSSGWSVSDGGTGKSTAEMKTLSTFTNAGWDTENIWTQNNAVNDGYLSFREKMVEIPIVSTKSIKNVRETSLTVYGQLRFGDVSSYGVCWNTTGDPDTSNNKIEIQSDSGGELFSVDIQGLEINTEYHFKVFVRGVSGNIAYGGEISAYTWPVVPAEPLGSGTYSDPYLISTLENLFWIRSDMANMDKYYLQVNDINASSTKNWNGGNGWFPIGEFNKEFKGFYNGCGNSIDSLYMNRTEDYYHGLFGRTAYATIINLGVTDCNITGNESVGALVGSSGASMVCNCYSSGCVNGSRKVGGLVGNSYASSLIYNSYSSVNASSGFVGQNSDEAEIINCYSRGEASESGFVSNNSHALIIGSFWDVESSGQTLSDGGKDRTSAEMKTDTTYVNAGWDMENIWWRENNTNDGYPHFVDHINDSPILYTKPVLANMTYYAKIEYSLIHLGQFDDGQHGICWNTTGSPTIEDEKIEMTGLDSTGKYSILMTELETDTHYYVRSFIRNDTTVVYSNTIHFETVSGETVMPEGSGTDEDPYQVSMFNNLLWLQHNPDQWDKHYIQTANIDASESAEWEYTTTYRGWKPIGNNDHPFTGIYDGQYFKIHSLTIEGSSLFNQGLFGFIRNAKISNVGLDNTYIKIIGGENIGSLVGRCDSSSIENCFSVTAIRGGNYVGGLIGYTNNSNVNACYVKGYDYEGEWSGGVRASDVTGGIAGYSENSEFTNCYNCASVNGWQVNPIVNSASVDDISHCYSKMVAWADDSIFGIPDSSSFCLGFYGYVHGNRYFQNSYRTSEEMKDPNMYLAAGWDFVVETENGTDDIWDIDTNGVINEGYPYLSWEDGVSSNFTSIEESVIPQNFILNQNFPNPFNPTTTLNYELPEQSDVQMIIFDISGRKIRQWSYQGQAAGTYKIKWNGKDSSGNLVPSGVYLYCLIADDFVDSKKMVLLK